MLSKEVAIGILVVFALVLGVCTLLLLRKKKFKLVGFFIFGSLAAFTYLNVLAHVYILDDELEGRYEERIAFFPSEYTFKNGQTATISPTFGLTPHSIIINDTSDYRNYSVVVYTSSSNGRRGPRPVAIEPHTARNVRYSPYYIYRTAPRSVSSSERGDIYRGVIK